QGSSQTSFFARFEVYNGSTMIDVFTLSIESLDAGQKTEYNFDRVYKYEGLAGAVSLRIAVIEGFQNQLFLDYLKAFNFKFCDDNVRNYFVLEDFFQNSFDSISSAIQLTEWKVGGVETLTPEFFAENNSP